jgi:hypothetical protein
MMREKAIGETSIRYGELFVEWDPYDSVLPQCDASDHSLPAGVAGMPHFGSSQSNLGSR